MEFLGVWSLNLIQQISATYVVICLNVLLASSSSATSSSNLEGRLSCLDFNCSLSWAPIAPQTSWDVLYSVYHAKTVNVHDVVQEWRLIDGCSNVTGTHCSIKEIFQTNHDFRVYQGFKINYVINGTTNYEGGRFKRDPLKAVVLSAPVVSNVDATSESISFQLWNDVTPPSSGLDTRQLGQFVNHKYDVTVYERPTNRTITVFQVINDLDAKQTVVDLHPDVEYAVVARSVVFPPETWSPDKTVRLVRTQEKAPSTGPRHLQLINTSFSCGEPDTRTGLIAWEAPEEEYWNGKLVLYEIRATLQRAREAQFIYTVDTSSTMFLLPELSRWEDYEVTVFANNSAGGTRSSASLLLEKHNLDTRGSKPSELTVKRRSQDRFNVTWQPPSNYHDCIMGYGVTWTDGSGAEHHVTVLGVNSVEVEGHPLRVAVTPLIRNGYENRDIGVTLYYKNVSGNELGFNPWFILLVGVAIVVVVVLVLVAAKWKYIRVKWLKPHVKEFNFDFDNNKILKQVYDRQVSYEPCKRTEQEVFDLPTPGIDPSGGLPFWSPDHTISIVDSSHQRFSGYPANLYQRGDHLVDDIDEIDLAEVMTELLHKEQEADDGQTSSKADSAIDTLSNDDERDMTVSGESDYILHADIHKHIHTITPIGDYSKTALSGDDVTTPQTNPDADWTSDAALDCQWNASDKCKVKGHQSANVPRHKAELSPYVPHWQIQPSPDSGKDSDSIADYSKQGVAGEPCHQKADINVKSHLQQMLETPDPELDLSGKHNDFKSSKLSDAAPEICEMVH